MEEEVEMLKEPGWLLECSIFLTILGGCTLKSKQYLANKTSIAVDNVWLENFTRPPL